MKSIMINKSKKNSLRNRLLLFFSCAAFVGAGALFAAHVTVIKADESSSLQVYDVTDYGADGKDSESDFQAIQTCLDLAKNNEGKRK